ncbi:MAG: phosphatase PAP2 family protein [Rhodobacteraceae bacterium]|nr:phosphatase PAP2 family protein [Paracoccaceae bacterium]
MTAVSDVAGLAMPKDDEYLGQVKTPYQALILDTFLRSSVRFDGADGWCELQTSAGLAITRLERPKSLDFFAKQLDWLRAYADLREDRLGEIHMQLDDMLSFFGSQVYLDNGRRAYSLMLLNAARSFAIHVETPMKYFCRVPRPVDFAMQVQPIIQTPDHSSFPSGHATEAFAIATVLHRLSSGQGAAHGVENMALPFRLAHRIAANRTVAGVHFPADSRVGAYIGCVVGDLIYALATGTDLVTGNANAGASGDDFLLSNFSAERDGTALAVAKLDVLSALWSRAASEWPGAPAALV